MPVMDEFQKEREELKTKSFKEKASYFWYYYKWWVIGILVAIICIINTVRGILNRTENLLLVYLLNVYEQESASEQITEAFLTENEIDTSKYNIELNANLTISDDYATDTQANQQIIAAHIFSGELDMVITDELLMQMYVYNGYLLPLSKYLDEDFITAHADDLYYIDQIQLEELQEKMQENPTLSYDDFTLKDPTKPEEMEQPVAVGLLLDNCEKFNANYESMDESMEHMIVGVIGNSSHIELAGKFIRFLWK